LSYLSGWTTNRVASESISQQEEDVDVLPTTRLVFEEIHRASFVDAVGADLGIWICAE
jgi:hypothetical protein